MKYLMKIKEELNNNDTKIENGYCDLGWCIIKHTKFKKSKKKRDEPDRYRENSYFSIHFI